MLVLTVAQLLREPGARSWNTIWAEDGAVYTSQAYASGAVSTLLHGYAGYAQLVPRLVVLGVRPLPVEWVAPYLAVTSALTSTLLALFVGRSMVGWVRSTVLRGVVVAMAALAPVLYFEIGVNIANLGWPLLLASFWAFASRRRGGLDLSLRCVVVALTALTTPVFVLLFPFALALLAIRRGRDDVVVLTAASAATFLQLLAIRAAPPGPSGPASGRDLVSAYGVRVLGSLVIGERWLASAWLHLGAGLVLLALAVLAAVVVLALPQRAGSSPGAERLVVVAGAVMLSVALFVVPVWIRGSADLRLTQDAFTGAGSRYVYVPVLLLVGALVLLVDSARREWLVPVLGVHAVVLIATSFPLANFRSDGPTWSAALPAAREQCRSAAAPASVSVPITPDGIGWAVVVPCGRLVR